MRWLDGITDAMGMNLGKLWKMVEDREAWHAAVCGVTESDMTGKLNKNLIEVKSCSIWILCVCVCEIGLFHLAKVLKIHSCCSILKNFLSF